MVYALYIILHSDFCGGGGPEGSSKALLSGFIATELYKIFRPQFVQPHIFSFFGGAECYWPFHRSDLKLSGRNAGCNL